MIALFSEINGDGETMYSIQLINWNILFGHLVDPFNSPYSSII